MRACLFLVLVLELTLGGITTGSSEEQLRNIALIRRAYIDVTGLLPTVEEIDWFVVYNNNSYNLAIDHLFQKYKPKLNKEALLSEQYKNQPPVKISDIQLKKSLIYVVGLSSKEDVTEALVNQAKQRLIEQALLCTDSAEDAIDYMCNVLMSRPSNVNELNTLNRKFKDTCALSNENRAWIAVLEYILIMPATNYR